MINIKELRIGNWVQKMDASQIQIQYATEIEEVSNSCIGIPLSFEILQKSGFIKTHRAYEYHFLPLELHDEDLMKNLLYAISNNSKILIGIEAYDRDEDGESQVFIGLRSIEFLHQLQNLFFSLTNRDLIISN